MTPAGIQRIGFRLVIILALLNGSSVTAWSQKVPREISRRDEKNIRAQAEQTIGSLTNLLNLVSDPGNTTSDLDDAIANAFNNDSRIRLFFNDFEADDDLDQSPDIDPADAFKGIQPYLRQYRTFYHQNKAGSIRYDITEISPIYIGEHNLYLKVYFNQLMNGKDRRDKAFPSKISKVAEMQVVSASGQYQTLISHLDRQIKDNRKTTAQTVAITDAGESSDDADQVQHSELYYRNQLQAGSRMIAENNYTEAYFALKEAKQFGPTAAEADAKINDLKARLRAQNIEPNEYLYDGLSSKAQTLQEKYRYTLAKRYYTYAKEVKPASAKNAAAAILAISQLQAKAQQLQDLLNKGSYSEAARGFEAAIQRDPENPALHVGLARAQAAQGNSSEAEEAFAGAVRADASYPETYKWRGFYFKERKDYRNAYDAFATYQTRAEDSGDKLIMSEMAFSRGRLAQMQSAPQAIEAYNSALELNPDNVEAMIALADLYRTQGGNGLKTARKLVEDALRKDNKFAEAYSIKARILETENDKKGAIEAYQEAIKYQKDNPRWYYEMGKLQMEVNDKTDNAAVLTFTTCINTRTAVREDMLLQTQAFWKRGKCYYLQNRIDEAESDYNNYVQKAKMLPTPFCLDYANLLIKRARYDEALLYLKKAGENPPALLSMGILNYTRTPSDESSYQDYFTRAFRDGVSEEAVKAAPNIRMVVENSSMVKSLMRKFKYNTDF